MARTSKTKIKGASAGEAANRARRGQTEDAARATAQAEARGARAEGQIERGVSATAGAVQSEMARGREREFRSSEAEKEREFRSDEGLKSRVARSGEAAAGRRQQQAQFEQSQEQRQAEMAQRGQQAEEQTDLRAAQAGLERDPEFARREQQLQDEMARGERQEIMPGELDGQRFVPTERREAQERSQTQQRGYQLETERMRVEAMRANSLTRARSAARKGDDQAYKAAKEDYASHVKKLGARAERIIKASSGDPRAQVTADDQKYLKMLAQDNPNPELQQELESGQLGQASARFLRGRMVKDSLDFVAERGDWPDQDLIDEAHPIYQQFQQEVVRAGDLLKQRQQMAGVAGVQTLADANRMKRKIAAIVMKEKARRQRQTAQMQGEQQMQGAPGGQQWPDAPLPPGGTNEQPGAGGVQVDRVERPELDLNLAPPSTDLGG